MVVCGGRRLPDGAVDACGAEPDAEDDVIARRLYGNPLAWGTTLIIIGTLFLLHTLLRVTLPIKELLPVALVALGAYMLFDYIRRSKSSDRIVRFDSRRPPPSVVAGTRPTDAANFSHRRNYSVCTTRREAFAVRTEIVIISSVILTG